jgi:hypothetical protein
LEAALTTPLPMDNHDDFPPPHQILPTVARPSTKVAGARRSLPELKGKGKENAVDQLAAAQPGKRKRKAASLCGLPMGRSNVVVV